MYPSTDVVMLAMTLMVVPPSCGSPVSPGNDPANGAESSRRVELGDEAGGGDVAPGILEELGDLTQVVGTPVLGQGAG
jgi:hypothetical protein